MRTTLILLFVAASTAANVEASGRGRHKKIYAVPCPGALKIDGNLDDGDFSGHIESFVREETRQSRHAKFAVMYDQQAIYLGADVRDASPMQNRHNPRADADKAWMGDCCQFRLVTNRKLPFPFLRGALGNADRGTEEGQPLHLTLWYFTDNQEPALQIHKSFAMEPVRGDWAPHGVVPGEYFDAAYREHDDGKGYTFEYRIPWATLNAEDDHPVSGDVVNATAQFLWSDSTGLNLAKGGVTYDIMSQPGFPWQTSGVWGKLIFTSQGSISRAMVEPYEAPAPPKPLAFSYDLPEDGEVSIGLFDEQNRVVRHIVAQAARKAGRVTETWDGLDASGKPLAVGTYRWKGLHHRPIETRYIMSVGNSGQPAWKTADGTGGWGGDYGPPTAACVAGDTVVLGWTGHEAGWGIIGVDLDGRKKWGAKQKNTAHLATDGKRFFGPAEHGSKGVCVYAVDNAQPLAFGNGRQGLQPPPGSDDEKDNAPTGIAYSEGKIYVSFAARDLIGVYGAEQGNLQTTWEVSQPGRLAIAKDGALLAVSRDRVVRVLDGRSRSFITDHIDEPAGLAVDAAGNVYVANHGALHNVSVFDSSAKYLRSIGKSGGRTLVGPFDPAGMRNPAGIAVDGKGQLWVPEAIGSPKRLSLWDSNKGKLINEFFGACSYSPFMWMDAANPHETFFDNTIWSIDLDRGTWKPKSVFYRRTSPNVVNSGGGGFFHPFRVFTANNGHQYAVSQVHGFGPVLWIRQGDRFRPLYFMFKNYPNPVLIPRPPFPIMQDKERYPPGHFYVWADHNCDLEVQLNELDEIPSSRRQQPPMFQWMDADLILYGQGARYRPLKIGQDGVPIYDFTMPENLGTEPPRASMWVDRDGQRMWSYREGGRGDIGFAQWTADGRHQWSYPPLQTWRDAINQGIPAPGRLIGPTCPLGVAERYTGLLSYFGTAELVRDDGLFVAQVFEHPARGNNGPHIFYVEFLAGQLVQPDGTDRYFLLAGDQDCRVTEILGLDTVKDLEGGTYQHTPEIAARAAAAWARYESLTARGQPLILGRGGEAGLAAAEPVGKSVDERRAFDVRATYDKQNLYFHYDVTSPSPLVNAIADPCSIFKGGNLIDIQIATDPNADGDRTKPVPGDVRLLISRRDDQTWAVALRPKVAGFTGEPIEVVSPTGNESFDVIAPTTDIELRSYRKTRDGFEVSLIVPRKLVGLPSLQPGDLVTMDVGYIFGDEGGENAAVRAYWHNNGFTANVVNDAPHESRLEPHQWGKALVE